MSELIIAKSPGLLRLMNDGDGWVFDTRRRFHAATPASNQPALRPTRGSGIGSPGAMPGREAPWAAPATGAAASRANDNDMMDERFTGFPLKVVTPRACG